MSKAAFVFWILVALDLIILAFGSLMYRIDQSSNLTMSALFYISVALTIGSGICWFMGG